MKKLGVSLLAGLAIALGYGCGGPQYPEAEPNDSLETTHMPGLGYAPCAEKPCGEKCTRCAPGDSKCSEPAEELACNEEGDCVSAPVTCGPGSREIERLD